MDQEICKDYFQELDLNIVEEIIDKKKLPSKIFTVAIITLKYPSITLEMPKLTSIHPAQKPRFIRAATANDLSETQIPTRKKN